MENSPPTPTPIPARGFYHHYKHDPAGPINNYAYLIVIPGLHTEKECPPQDKMMMVYLPLYPEASVYKAGRFSDLRPFDLFTEPVEINGEKKLRFSPITDSETIAELTRIYYELYPPILGIMI